MSTLDIFVEKGIKQGEERKGYEVVKKMLEVNRFTIAEIANFASVSEAFVVQVKNEISK